MTNAWIDIQTETEERDDTRDAKVYLEIMAMHPSGHDLWLQVPRYALGLPLPSRKHFDAATPPVSAQEVIDTIDAIYNKPERELRAWAEAQSFLKKR